MGERVITVDRLRARAEALRRLVADCSESPATGSGGLQLFGRGTLEIAAGLGRLEARTLRSVWNVQPGSYLDPEDEITPLLDSRSRRRGVDLRMLVDERAARANPLLASTEREGCRVAPVFLRMLVTDARVAVVEGLPCANGEPTAWWVEGGEVAAAAVHLWRDSLAISHPFPVPAAGLLTERQVDVARAMCRAVPDQRLAMQLGISLRSVEREVAAVVRHVGARCRGEAVLRLLGRHRDIPAARQGRRVG